VPPLATDLFDYDLPARLIAQTPAARRDGSRLMVVHRASRHVEHTFFSNLPRFLRAGDTLFRNNAAVLPARLRATRPGGGAAECLLLRPDPAHGDNVWRCLVRPGKKLRVGETFSAAGEPTAFTGSILAKDADGTVLVRFVTLGGEPITAVANRLGDVPLPPYIVRDAKPTGGTPVPRRADSGNPGGIGVPPMSAMAQRTTDLERYQTVYADRARQVAVAAPTAGLHFTPELLAALSTQGVDTADVTLHVGLGTFKPITTATIQEHAIHRETCELPVATQRALLAPSGRRVAVGTTSVRAVENFLLARQDDLVGAQSCCALSEGCSKTAPLHPHVAEAGIFIYPPFTFRGVDALITNFHQPRSTLLCLVAAFLAPGSTDGIAWLRELYAEAVAREYRFFSYGDAMLIL
jgi:S-adenosylmethionine:tRNA ribosyltransferase-isomerase